VRRAYDEADARVSWTPHSSGVIMRLGGADSGICANILSHISMNLAPARRLARLGTTANAPPIRAPMKIRLVTSLLLLRTRGCWTRGKPVATYTGCGTANTVSISAEALKNCWNVWP